MSVKPMNALVHSIILSVAMSIYTSPAVVYTQLSQVRERSPNIYRLKQSDRPEVKS